MRGFSFARLFAMLRKESLQMRRLMSHYPMRIVMSAPNGDYEVAERLKTTPRFVRRLVAEPKAKDSSNTILSKDYAAGNLTLIGANSPRGFRRTSRRVVIFDEVDGYPAGAGTEGERAAQEPPA